MKVVANILVSIFFLISTIGVSVDKHYCMSFLRSTNIFSTFDEADCCGEIEKELDDCCHDEKVYLSIEDDYYLSSNSFKFQKIELEFVPSATIVSSNILCKDFHEFIFDDIPPPFPIKIHMLNCVFLT